MKEKVVCIEVRYAAKYFIFVKIDFFHILENLFNPKILTSIKIFVERVKYNIIIYTINYYNFLVEKKSLIFHILNI